MSTICLKILFETGPRFVYFYGATHPSVFTYTQEHTGVAWKVDQSDVTLIVEHSNTLKFMSNIKSYFCINGTS